MKNYLRKTILILKRILQVLLGLILLAIVAFIALSCYVHWVEKNDISYQEAPDTINILKRERNIIEKGLAGDSDAQRRLSIFYFEGSRGAKRNYVKARKWAEKAAAQGNKDSLFRLGYLYYHGLSVKTDYNKAYNYFLQAERFSWEARLFLGLMFYKGQGVQKDTLKALEWFHSTPYDCAYMLAGNIYWAGGEKDKAFTNWKHFVNPEDMGIKTLCKDIPLVLKDEENLFKQSMQQAIQQGFGEASYIWTTYNNENWTHLQQMEGYERAAQAGNKEAQFVLGDLYYRGINTSKDYARAFEYFKQAYEHETPHFCANTALANMYYQGLGTEKNVAKAKKLWAEGDRCLESREVKKYNLYSFEAFQNYLDMLKTAKDAESLYQAGQKCTDYNADEDRPHPSRCGHSVSPYDEGRDFCDGAYEFFKAAADLGYADAQYELAHMYYDNYNADCMVREHIDEDKHDPRQALDLFIKAANQGHINAMFMAGLMYLQGPSFYDYPEQDSKKAEKWFLKAAKLGDSASALELVRLYAQGLGIPKDEQKARYWAKKVTEIDPTDKSANYYLGLLAYDKKQYQKAFELWSDCPGAQHEPNTLYSEECINARYQLSKLYANGIGVEKDLEKAQELYKDTRHHNFTDIILPKENIPNMEDPNILYALAMGQITLPSGQPNSTSCVIDSAPQRHDWLKKAADMGHAQAALELSKMYKDGVYVYGNGLANSCLGWGWRWHDVIIARDEEKARYYFEKANNQLK